MAKREPGRPAADEQGSARSPDATAAPARRRPYSKPTVERRGRIEPSLQFGSPPPPPKPYPTLPQPPG